MQLYLRIASDAACYCCLGREATNEPDGAKKASDYKQREHKENGKDR